MIPLTRRTAAQRAVSYTRQTLPRPARLYSTPTKSLNAPETFTAPAAATDFPAFMPSSSKSDSRQSSIHQEMHGFLHRRAPYTILPTPHAGSVASGQDIIFQDTPSQDRVAMMDACLHGLHDVPRAKVIFEELRATKQGEQLLDTRTYNTFIDAYLTLASRRETVHRGNWVEDAWLLYDAMERESARGAPPTPHTYALILQAWLRFGPESENPVTLSGSIVQDPVALLRNIVRREIAPALVVSDRAFTSSEEATEAIRALSKAALHLGMTNVVSELGLAESLGKQAEDPLEDVPEVMPVTKPKKIETTQRHDGTLSHLTAEEPLPVDAEVPFNLETLRRHLSQVVLARRVLSEDTMLRQRLLEQSVLNVAAERMKHQAELFDQLGLPKQGLHSNDLRAWMWEWHQKLEQRIAAELENVIVEERVMARKAAATRRTPLVKEEIALGPFLTLLSPEKLSLIAIMEMMNLHGSGGVTDGMKTARALLTIGRAVEMEYKAEMCKKNNISVPLAAQVRAGESNVFSSDGYRDLYARRVAARKYTEETQEWTSEWTQLIRIKVGSFLMDCLMDVATVQRTMKDPRTGEKLSEEQPAFYHQVEYVRGQRLGVIKFNPAVAERMSKDPIAETLHPRHLPMLVKPKPWLSHNNGGYLYSPSWAMRFKESREQEVYLRQASDAGHLELVFAGLDVLSSTGWRINRKVFDVVLEVWNSGERFGKIPPAVPDEPEPERPDNIETDARTKNNYLERQKMWQQKKAANHSERCSVNYKVEIARAFLGDTFYLPHNVDFRGRAYPIPPHLSHIGDDLSRGLLVFDEAKPLRERGLRWLKIHLANLYGFDKASFDERVQFVHDHLEEIYDSAERPLEGKRWWTQADDPWQCLATCIEVRNALTSPEPEAYECALPVHQDGTCNGLQHYAALGGDAQGAAQVNLAAADRPSDVYTYVARMVEDAIKKDLEDDNEIAQLLSGKIARKVVKQTVMTTVYGVTYVGAREQIERQLRDRSDIPAERCWAVSAYLTKKVLASIGDLFKGAKDIQTWLNLCARLISKAIPQDRLMEALNNPPSAPARARVKKPTGPKWKNEQMTSVVWTTPLGLPIVQPYRSVKRRQVMTSLQTVFISDPNVPTTVNSQKQASAFPPNFVHSLDATHMMLTALECRSHGLTFASVHDSYWTHAGNIDQMSAMIRDTFIALHSSDVLKKLREEFMERYVNYKVPLIALRGKTFQRLNVQPEAIGVSKEDIAVLTNAGTEESAEDTSEAVDDDDAAFDADVAADAEVEVPVKPKPRRGRKPAGRSAQDVEALLADKFVNLIDVLPPLPEKGKFDVKLIKDSQYFFS